jgi:hypothetical protein
MRLQKVLAAIAQQDILDRVTHAYSIALGYRFYHQIQTN